MHASGAAAPTSSVPCQFYRLGTCRYGSRCRFLHDAPAAPATRASPTPGGREHCRFFDAGRCRCGAQCRFAHAAHVAEEIAGEPRVPDRPPALQAPPARPPAEQAPAVPFELFHRIADFLEAGVEGHQYSRFADTVVLAQTCRALRAQLAGRLRRRFLELLREWDVEVYASLVLNFDPRSGAGTGMRPKGDTWVQTIAGAPVALSTVAGSAYGKGKVPSLGVPHGSPVPGFPAEASLALWINLCEREPGDPYGAGVRSLQICGGHWPPELVLPLSIPIRGGPHWRPRTARLDTGDPRISLEIRVEGALATQRSRIRRSGPFWANASGIREVVCGRCGIFGHRFEDCPVDHMGRVLRATIPLDEEEREDAVEEL